ncbi:uncharacterized protein G2W53_044576 [Senna tora]|uniref:Uncharacterized protein n=1 Tax=Senna tora TaxID=362788 RepID=A0A834VX15_9FABA|nr:uncharacterized protein G2W53_044576 [Senna tora]
MCFPTVGTRVRGRLTHHRFHSFATSALREIHWPFVAKISSLLQFLRNFYVSSNNTTPIHQFRIILNIKRSYYIPHAKVGLNSTLKHAVSGIGLLFHCVCHFPHNLRQILRDDKVSIAIISSKKGCNIMSWNHPSLMIPNNKDTGKSVIEHGKSRDLLRWRKRIGHMFHIIRWNKSIKPTTCHVGSNKVEGVKMMRKVWMRTLTKRKTKA